MTASGLTPPAAGSGGHAPRSPAGPSSSSAGDGAEAAALAFAEILGALALARDDVPDTSGAEEGDAAEAVAAVAVVAALPPLPPRPAATLGSRQASATPAQATRAQPSEVPVPERADETMAPGPPGRMRFSAAVDPDTRITQPTGAGPTFTGSKSDAGAAEEATTPISTAPRPTHAGSPTVSGATSRAVDTTPAPPPPSLADPGAPRDAGDRIEAPGPGPLRGPEQAAGAHVVPPPNPPAEPSAAPAPPTEPTATQARPSPAVAEAAGRIADALDGLRPIPQGGVELDIELHDLGLVKLRVEPIDGTLRVSLSTDDPTLAQKLERSRAGILEALHTTTGGGSQNWGHNRRPARPTGRRPASVAPPQEVGNKVVLRRRGEGTGLVDDIA